MALHLPQPPQAYDPTDQAQMRRILELEDKKNRKVALDAAGDVVDGGSALTGGGESPLIVPQGRLTLASGVPFLTSDVTGATTVFYTPAIGDRCPIYNATTGKWATHRFAELSQALSDTTRAPAAAVANANYDYFLGLDAGGNVALYRGPMWQKSAPVALTIAAPCVLSYTGHALLAGTPFQLSTTGALPTGVSAGTTYYVGGSKATVTMTIASPCVVTWNAHGLSAGMTISFSTTGALPNGVIPGATHFVVPSGLTANAFQFAATIGGVAINTSGSQSGTHSAYGGQGAAANSFSFSPTFGGNFINTSGSQSGTHAIIAENDIGRGTGAGTSELTGLNGILVNTNAITNGPAANKGTYVGTIRTSPSNDLYMQFLPAGLPGGSNTFLFLWNMYNRRKASSRNYTTTDSWPYTSLLWRIRENSIGNRINFVIGWAEDSFIGTADSMSKNSLAGVLRAIALSYDNITTVSASVSGITGVMEGTTAAGSTTAHCSIQRMPSIGYHAIAAMEISVASGTTTWFGDNGGAEINSNIEFSMPM